MINYAYIDDLSEGLCPDAHSEVDFFPASRRGNRCAQDNDGGRTSVRHRPVIGSRRLKASTNKVYGYNYGDMDGFYTVQEFAKDDVYARAVKDCGGGADEDKKWFEEKEKVKEKEKEKEQTFVVEKRVQEKEKEQEKEHVHYEPFAAEVVSGRPAAVQWQDVVLYGVTGVLAILLLEQIFQMGARSARS